MALFLLLFLLTWMCCDSLNNEFGSVPDVSQHVTINNHNYVSVDHHQHHNHDHGSDHKNLKILILSFDNRALTTSWNTENVNYYSVTSVINKEYAMKHGYDFLQVKTDMSGFVDRVKKKYNLDNLNGGGATGTTWDQPTSFNVGLKQFRAATWAKMPALWAVLEDYPKKYDYIMFMDSDAAISPFYHNKSFTDAMDSWAADPKSVVRGNKNPYNASFIFLNNNPWRVDMPCAGVFFVNTKLAEPILREWWDYNLPEKNFKHFHEQDALWHQIESADKYKFLMNTNSFSLMAEHQFPSRWQPHQSLWICHVASYNYVMRKPIFHSFLLNLSISDPKIFGEKVTDININNTFSIDMLDVAERMEAVSAKNPELRKTEFPPHVDSGPNWYDANAYYRKDEPPVDAAIRYEGCLVAFTKGIEIFVVQNGKKRGIPNWDTFQAMKLDSGDVFRLPADELNSIPSGDSMPKLDFSGRLRKRRLWLGGGIGTRSESSYSYSGSIFSSIFNYLFK